MWNQSTLAMTFGVSLQSLRVGCLLSIEIIQAEKELFILVKQSLRL